MLKNLLKYHNNATKISHFWAEHNIKNLTILLGLSFRYKIIDELFDSHDFIHL